MSMCKGPLGTLRGPWGGSGQHVTLGEGGGASGQHVTLGGGTSGQHVTLGGGGGGASACSTHFHTSVDLTHP